MIVRIHHLPDHPDYVHPGMILADLMEDNMWTPSDCSEISGLNLDVISRLLTGEIVVSPEIAEKLSRLSAFGTGSWLNSEKAYQENVEAYLLHQVLLNI